MGWVVTVLAGGSKGLGQQAGTTNRDPQPVGRWSSIWWPLSFLPFSLRPSFIGIWAAGSATCFEHGEFGNWLICYKMSGHRARMRDAHRSVHLYGTTTSGVLSSPLMSALCCCSFIKRHGNCSCNF